MWKPCIDSVWLMACRFVFFVFSKQKTAYEVRISDWSSDVCSSDLETRAGSSLGREGGGGQQRQPVGVARGGVGVIHHEHHPVGAADAQALPVERHIADPGMMQSQRCTVLSPHLVPGPPDRQSVVSGKSVSVSVGLGGGRIIK